MMKPFILSVLLMGTLASGVINTYAAPAEKASSKPMSTANDSKPLSAQDKTFMNMAAPAGIAEVKFSQLALQKTKDPEVKTIAQHLVTDHSRANNDLKTIAQKMNVKLPADMDAPHKAAYAKLSKLSGKDFDKAYIAGQVPDHEKAIALFTKETQSGSNGRVVNFAKTYLPGIKMHTGMIKTKNNSLKK